MYIYKRGSISVSGRRDVTKYTGTVYMYMYMYVHVYSVVAYSVYTVLQDACKSLSRMC